MFFFFLGAAQNNCINGNFQEKRISADSDYGQQSSGKLTIDFVFYLRHNIIWYYVYGIYWQL